MSCTSIISSRSSRFSHEHCLKSQSFLLSFVHFLEALPVTLQRVLRFLFPRNLHVILLRFALWLPGLREESPSLAGDIVRYIAGHTPLSPLASRPSQGHGSLASSVGIRKDPASLLTSTRFVPVKSASLQVTGSFSRPSANSSPSTASSTLRFLNPPSRLSSSFVSSFLAATPPIISVPPGLASLPRHKWSNYVHGMVPVAIGQTMAMSVLMPRDHPRERANGIWLRKGCNSRPTRVEWEVRPTGKSEISTSVGAELRSRCFKELAWPKSPATLSSEFLATSPLSSISRHSSDCLSVNPPSRLQPGNEAIRRIHCSVPDRLYHKDYSFIIGGQIGEGGFGRVVSALLVGTAKWYAIKIVCKSKQYGMQGAGRASLIYERHAMVMADEHNLSLVNKLLLSWDDEEHVYFVMVCLTSWLETAYSHRNSPYIPRT